jgi:type IV pilus assembly protein PilN
MRIGINLASRPYEDERRFHMQWVPILALLAIAACVLVGFAVVRFRQVRSIGREIAQVQQKLNDLEKIRSTAQTTLDQPENRGTRDQAQFLNQLFVRKAFSWTEVLSDLEKLMPGRAQVTSIRPDITKDNQIIFRLKVVSPNRDAVNDLVRNMETSDHFRQTQIVSERAKEAQRNGGQSGVEFEISSVYVPSKPAAASPAGAQ